MTDENIINPVRPAIPELQNVIFGISEGSYDGSFEEIEKAMSERREARKEAVLAQVREVFGDDYVVRASMPPMEPMPVPSEARATVLSETDAQARLEETNPFFRNKRPDPFEDSDDEGVTNPSPPTDNEVRPQNEVERQMVERQGIEALPIEQRGAIIGGLSSSDMGD